MKTKLLLQIAIALVAMGCSENVDRISPVAESYVNEIMDVMQKNAINRNAIDWAAVRTKAIQLAGTAKTIKETYASITFALGSLNDNHSFYKAVDGTYLYNQATGCNVSSPPNAYLWKIYSKCGVYFIKWSTPSTDNFSNGRQKQKQIWQHDFTR